MIVQEIARDVWLLSATRPAMAVNQYLVGGVLVDAGTRFAARRLLRSVRGREVRAHLLSHAHPDHQGATRALCRRLRIPLWCGAGDIPAAEDPREMLRRLPFRGRIGHLGARAISGPGCRVDRAIREGDAIDAGFVAIEAPGHTAGHLALWRESDGVLIAGDVAANYNFARLVPELRLPPPYFSTDPERNRASARRLAGLRPRLVAFGHGPPLADAGAFQEFVAALGSGRGGEGGKRA